ncbi:MAG: hypothetical protein RLN89_14495 [Parvibaculum sp.]
MTYLLSTMRLAAAATLVGIMVLISAGSSLAEDRNVKIINETSVTMVEFFASNVGENDWQEDILGQDVLQSGSSVMVNIDDGTGYCLFDFKAVFSDGDTVTDEKIDVCKVSTYRFGAAPTAQTRPDGLNRQVRIINETRVTMREFYASNVDAETWEEDILGADLLPPGESVMITIDDGSGYCLYDFKAVFTDGDELERKRVNVCEISSYRYHE